MFLNKDFFPKNSPAGCQYHNKAINYNDFKEKCPVAEKACYEEAVWITQNVLLGSEEGMDDIVKAVEKVKENIKEL